MWRGYYCIIVIFITIFSIFNPYEPAKAQLPELNNVRVNFAYTFLDVGFGFYKVGGVDAKLFQIPISHTFDLPKHEN